MNHRAEIKMNVDQFLAWYENQPSGRFELFNGEIVPMSPERSQHNLTKFYVARAFTDAIKSAGADCTAYTDGMGVRINNDNLYEPDASIQAGKALDRNATELTKPVVVVEVLSPSTTKIDTMSKLADYLSVASIAHYLVIDGDHETVVHHQRISSSECETRIVTKGSIKLDPPGIEVPVAAFFGKV
jgi:Uma2 family endonuclease